MNKNPQSKAVIKSQKIKNLHKKIRKIMMGIDIPTTQKINRAPNRVVVYIQEYVKSRILPASTATKLKELFPLLTELDEVTKDKNGRSTLAGEK